MTERPNVPVLKTGVGLPTVGSNPTPSAASPSFEGDDVEPTLRAGLVGTPHRIVLQKARPDFLALGTSEWARNDALDACAGVQLSVGIRSEVEAPRGRRIESIVGGRHQIAEAVIEIDDRNGPLPAAAPTSCGEPDWNPEKLPSEAAPRKTEEGAIRFAEEARAPGKAQRHAAPTAEVVLLFWCESLEAVLNFFHLCSPLLFALAAA
jgi:hypothetical protein